MTSTERSRRRRARLDATKPATKHSTGDDTARIRQLEADNRLLKAELARERERRKAAEAKASTTTDERVAQLEAKLRKSSLQIDGLLGDLNRIAKAHGGMRVDEYNKIVKVLHPDRKPSDTEKNEAFRLFTESVRKERPRKRRK